MTRRYIDGQRLQVWVTKYALTSGIFQITGEIVRRDKDKKPYIKAGFLFTTDWWHTLDDAKADARAMRDRRVASIERQIIKLQAMTFDDIAATPEGFSTRAALEDGGDR